MIKFTLLVNGEVYGPNAGYHALCFAQAALNAGHQIQQVFFYQNGVTQSNILNAPASDELDLTSAWQTLAIQWKIPLINCVSAALRRGVLSQQDAQDNDKSTANLAHEFTMGGLGELITGIEQSDRLVSF